VLKPCVCNANGRVWREMDPGLAFILHIGMCVHATHTPLPPHAHCIQHTALVQHSAQSTELRGKGGGTEPHRHTDYEVEDGSTATHDARKIVISQHVFARITQAYPTLLYLPCEKSQRRVSWPFNLPWPCTHPLPRPAHQRRPSPSICVLGRRGTKRRWPARRTPRRG